MIAIGFKLSTFREESSFDTWVYRVAVNYLLTARKVRAKDPSLTFSMFSTDLLAGLSDDESAAPDDHVMLNELRIKCTMAMLMCLDQAHRAAYILGEILELDHREAADILDVEPANFRKRLSRARSGIMEFTAQSCGLANPQAPCSCNRRLPVAQELGRIGTAASPIFSDAPDHKSVSEYAAQTNAALIAAKLQRATGQLKSPKDFAAQILSIVDPPG